MDVHSELFGRKSLYFTQYFRIRTFFLTYDKNIGIRDFTAIQIIYRHKHCKIILFVFKYGNRKGNLFIFFVLHL